MRVLPLHASRGRNGDAASDSDESGAGSPKLPDFRHQRLFGRTPGCSSLEIAHIWPFRSPAYGSHGTCREETHRKETSEGGLAVSPVLYQGDAMDVLTPPQVEPWRGFRAGLWQTVVDVRDFI